eukprot:1277898-Rhodomonas_salina.2
MLSGLECYCCGGKQGVGRARVCWEAACGGLGLGQPASASAYHDGDHVARPRCKWAVALAAAGSHRTPQ